RRHTRSKRDWSSDVCSSDLSKTNIDCFRGVFILRFRNQFTYRRSPPSVRQLLLMAAIIFISVIFLSLWLIDRGIRPTLMAIANRSEERRVGKESRYRNSQHL